MAIRRTGPGRWVVDVYVPGGKGQRIRAVYEGSYEAACRYEHDLLGGRPSQVIGRCPTVRELVPEYLAWARLHRAARTVSTYAQSFPHLEPIFGSLQMVRITTAHIEAYKRHRTQEGARRIFRSVNKDLFALKALIRWAVRFRALPAPTFICDMLPYERPLPQPPEPADVERVLQAVDRPNGRDILRRQAAILLLWECGLRLTEMRMLHWEDVSLTAKTALVKHTKRAKWRYVSLSDRLVGLLARIQQEKGWIFAGRTGQPWRSIRSGLHAACVQAGVRPFSHHSLRHAYATDTLDAGADVRHVQAGLGHSQITQTQWYTRISMARAQVTAAQTAAYRANRAEPVRPGRNASHPYRGYKLSKPRKSQKK